MNPQIEKIHSLKEKLKKTNSMPDKMRLIIRIENLEEIKRIIFNNAVVKNGLKLTI